MQKKIEKKTKSAVKKEKATEKNPKPAKLSSDKDFKRLLRLRRKMKVKRPKFVRIESWAQPSLKQAWRKPQGRHSKTKARIWGRPKMPTAGYGSPHLVRGLNPQGFREVRIFCLKDLEKISKEKEIVVIASAVGKKKRAEILKRADGLGIKLKNRPIIEEAKKTIAPGKPGDVKK